MQELYKKYRPQTLKEVIGQKDALSSLVTMGKNGNIPHFLLFTGPSGCGKTTLCRIFKRMLRCSDNDFIEINAAKENGIDVVRGIERAVNIHPIGESRIWLMDECHMLTGPAQQAFLKVLEDTPSSTYFFFATTNPEKLKSTIKTRAHQVKCNAISKPDLEKLVQSVCDKETKEVDASVVKEIARIADGSARKALVLLHAVIDLSKDDALDHLQSADVQAAAIDIARALMKKTSWSEMAKILKNVDEEPESIRHLVLAYCTTILLKGNNSKAAAIIEEFRDNWYDCKRAGLVISCYNIVNGAA